MKTLSNGIQSLPVYVLGAGAFAREVAEFICEFLGGNIKAFVAPPEESATTQVHPVMADEDLLLVPDTYMQVLGAGIPALRIKLLEQYDSRSRDSWLTLIHPRSTISPSCQIEGRSIFVASGAVISTNASLEDGSLINWNATIGHDVTVGTCSVVSPGANIGGFVHIEERCFIGQGAQVLPGRLIGAGSTVGAGAVVTKDVEPGTTVVGNPARIALPPQVSA